MSRNTLIALGLVVGLTLLLGWFLRDQWFDFGPLEHSSVAVEPLVELLPLDPALSPPEVDLADTAQAGPVQISGIISSFESSVAPAAQVFLYRVQFPAQFNDRGGVSLWEVLDWDQLRDGGGSQITTLPLRKDLSQSLILHSETVADGRGRYQFRDLNRGSYLVAAVTEGSLVTPAHELIELEDAPIRRDLWLLRGSQLTVQTIDSQGVVADAKVIVRGNLVDPAAGGEAWYFSSEELLLYMLNPPMQGGRTDADGRVQFHRLPGLDYQVYAIKDPLAQASQRLTLSTSREITLLLDTGARIDGVVVSTSGVEIEGAIVRLRDPDQGRWAQLPRPLPHAVSDASGRFQLLGIPGGTFEISCEAKGFVDGRLRGIEPDPESPLPIVVELEPGALIRGIVRDESGDPLAGIELEATQRPRGSSDKTFSDEQGEFVIDTVKPGEYRLTCKGTEWKQQRLTIETGPDQIEVVLQKAPILTGRVIDPRGNPISRARVQLGQNWGSGDSASTDDNGRFTLLLHLDETGLEILARGFLQSTQQIDPTVGGDLGDVVLAEAEVVEGIVYSPDGKPVSGARITANQVRQGGRNRRRGGSSTAWSKSDGSFRISFPRPDSQWRLTASFPLLLASEELTIDPQGQNTTGVKLMLRWGAVVSGIVTGEGMPVPDATISFQTGGRGWNQNNRSTRTDETGHFQISGLVEGKFSIRASAQGFGDTLLSDQLIRADEQLRIDLKLLRETTLSGIVIDQRGAPVNGAQLSVSDSTGARRGGLTGLDGYFSIDQLAPGLVDVRCDSSGYLRTQLREIDPVHGPIEIVLEQEFSLRGVVVDLETGEGIQRARVSVRSESSIEQGRNSRGRWDRSNREGEFKVDGLSANQYQVSAAADGFVTATFSVQIPSADTDESILIRLDPGGRVIVDVVDQAGTMVKGANLRATLLEENPAENSSADSNSRRGSNRSAANTTTDDTGRGILAGLLDGFYRVSIDHSMYIPTQSVAVVKKSDGSARVRVVLERGASIRGQVRDSSGTLLQGGRVSARSPGLPRRNGEIDQSGNYSVSGLSAGSYDVIYESRRTPLDPPPRGQVDLSGSDQRVLDLRP
ncbi:MAG: carboxypeptidase regulatory-like domain-containing protein [Planctomycetes bacterium]|jgi:protocatechuate 3,4-dioxygenase beta subunit|nr:carboxypeptidase regulatory-like domain-containing protein [Planctomycetota bacterium]MBT6453151.1 carboxypeptidase regulatory-like domain-containing protein [Planctomycetota bacterium]MBT6541372.1 carboxypeptidase regulatory-like domain-containing protein [Planctomycetota bacterium]MBT6784881.1 carboxypeptidase regulatory-like domain-containing protein [Planctomycetota bacterium]MBT6967630.1 carboxypeptidase regulatory-like domain-containing protein [Planctomycetota bacterium]